MARPKAQVPARRYHISGQDVVTIAGRDFYLGKHDSPEAIARYGVLIYIYKQGGFTLPDNFETADLDAKLSLLLGTSVPTNQADEPITVCHVTAAYREHIRRI